MHTGGLASWWLVELEEDVHQYYLAFLELDSVLGRVHGIGVARAGGGRGVAAGAREAVRGARMETTSPLEAGLLESGLAGLEARLALGVRQLPELDKMTDRYYKVFLEVVVVVKRVVVAQHALVESVLVLREGEGVDVSGAVDGREASDAVAAGGGEASGTAGGGEFPGEYAGLLWRWHYCAYGHRCYRCVFCKLQHAAGAKHAR